LILDAAMGETMCLGIAGCERIVGSGVGVGGGKHKSSLPLHNWKDKVPVGTSITAPIVVRYSLPRMMGI